MYDTNLYYGFSNRALSSDHLFNASEGYALALFGHVAGKRHELGATAGDKALEERRASEGNLP